MTVIEMVMFINAGINYCFNFMTKGVKFILVGVYIATFIWAVFKIIGIGFGFELDYQSRLYSNDRYFSSHQQVPTNNYQRLGNK